MSDEKGKWKDIILSKYGLESGRSQSRLKYQSWWWRDLAKVCGEEEEDGWFQNSIVWKVHARDKVRFWKDVWAHNNNLKSLYLRLYSLSLDQGMTVGEVGS